MAELEFEDILPYVEGEGDTGKTAREKINGNFRKVVNIVENNFSTIGEGVERTATISSSVLNKDTGAITSVSVANNVVDTFPVSQGSRYYVEYKTWTLGQTARAWGVIYDSNDNPIEILGVLKTSGEETSSEDTEFTRIITVPVGGTKLRIGYNSTSNVVSKVYSAAKIDLKEVVEQVNRLNTGTSQMASQVEQLEEDTRTLEDRIVSNTTIKDEIITADETIGSAAIRGTGTNIGSIATGLSVAGYIVDVCYIQPSTTYYIDYETAQVGANVRLWGAVYDCNDVMLESFGALPVQTDSYTPDDLKRQLYYKTPSNAAVIKLGYHNGGGTTTSSLYTTEVFNIPQKIEELENSTGASDAVSHTIINNPKIDLKKSNLKVLHIGNSFMAGATGYLSQFISAAGIDVSDMCMYLLNRSSGSFKSWYNVYHDSDTTTYSISKRFGGITPEGIPSSYTSYSAGDGSGFRNMINLVKWDLIVIQQASTYSNSHNGWEGTDNAGYLVEFLRIIRTLQPQATIGFHLCHASPKQSPGGNTTVAGDTLERHAEIAEATKWISSRYGIDFVIPYGTAIENLRISSLNTTSNEFTYDNHHLADGLAQYVANATYFQTLLAPRYGISVLGNSFRKTVTSSELSKYTVNQDNAIDVTDSNYYVAQMCAILAVNNMYDVINPDGVDL